MIGVNMDISERKRAEAALSESEERFRTMADTAPVMLWVTGPDKRATFFNKSCMDFTGHSMEQKLGDGWVADLHPEDREQFLAVFSSSNDARQEFHTVYRLRRADGEYRWVLHTGVPRFAPDETFAGYIGSCIDITELRRSQQEALARQKLEDLGVLARGIAHDFNNLLGSILAEAELVEDELAEGLSPDDGIARIKTVAIRGAEIVRELMIYAGQDQTNVVEQVDLSRLAAEMLELMKVSISKNVVLKLELDKNLPAVLGSASQIRQVLMNLVINASEAIGEKEGTIQVTTSRVTGGDYVRLEVSDSGCGLTEEARAKIFDPFYTTKFAGRGLGLAVVQGIVRAHNGTIDVVSLPGQGATFRVLLACSSEAQNTITSSGADRSHARTNGTVLVVEDEEVLRLAVSKGLRRRGFSVIEAKDGSVAMNLMRTHIDEIDVILLDLTLPGASSREVFEEAKRMRTNLKVVLTSAYDRRTVDASFPGLRLMQFIRKPFQLDDLAGTLRDALAS
jgi:PAS domain S-box-containing protein